MIDGDIVRHPEHIGPQILHIHIRRHFFGTQIGILNDVVNIRGCPEAARKMLDQIAIAFRQHLNDRFFLIFSHVDKTGNNEWEEETILA